MHGNRKILGLDIGSTKITAVAGEIDSSRGAILRSLHVRPTDAIDRGVIRDLNAAAADIDTAFSGAVYSSGISGESVYVGITGNQLRSVSNRAVLDISNKDGEIMQEDIDQVSEQAQRVSLGPGEQTVHYLVREFALDGLRTSSWPLGMIGSRLEADALVVVGNSKQVQNIDKALHRVGLEVQSYVYSLIAAAEAVLSDEDRNGGCILIDFGGRTTNVGVFYSGALAFSRCIPIGSGNFDQDLKQGLGVDIDEAQRIKKTYGKAWLDVDLEELDELVPVKYYGRREFDRVKRRRVFEVMQPRMEELVEQVILAIQQSGMATRISGGAIITGGGSQLRQLKPFLQKHLHRPVRLGIPTGIANLLDEHRSPAYASPLGLLLYGARYDKSAQLGRENFGSEIVEALSDVLSGLFESVRGAFGGRSK
jgi:cell division protein FtsA